MDMKKNRLVILLGTLFFIFALVKYAFIKGELPTSFVVLEVASFMVVLYLIYHFINFIETCMHGKDKAKMDRDCMKRYAEIEALKAKLEQYESNTAAVKKIENDQNELFEYLRAKLVGETLKSANDIVAVLKEKFEIMAAIGYHSKGDGSFEPLYRFGLDDEHHIETITIGDGIHGQSIADNQVIELNDIPEEYFCVGSGTGDAKPNHLYILPLLTDNNEGIVVELASFKRLNIKEVWQDLFTNK